MMEAQQRTRMKLDRELIANMYQNGATMREIAEAVGTNNINSISAIISNMRKDDCYAERLQRKRDFYTDAEKIDIFRMRQAGVPYKEIAKKYDRTEEAIHTLMYKDPKIAEMKREASAANDNKEEATMSSNDSILQSDYAKAYLGKDSRWTNDGSLDIAKTIEICSKKTKVMYVASSNAKSVSIRYQDSSIDIPMEVFEKFADEIVDVYINIGDFFKKH